jgi:hypothetical protein
MRGKREKKRGETDILFEVEKAEVVSGNTECRVNITIRGFENVERSLIIRFTFLKYTLRLNKIKIKKFVSSQSELKLKNE